MYLAFEFNLFFHLQSVEVFNPGASVDESDEFVMIVFDVKELVGSRCINSSYCVTEYMIFVYKSWTAEKTNPKKIHDVSYKATAENDFEQLTWF